MSSDSSTGTAACEVHRVRAQRQNVLQTWDDLKDMKVEKCEDGDSMLKIGSGFVLCWNQVAMASITLNKNGEILDLVLASNDHSHFDFIEISLAMTPPAAALLQTIHGKVEVTSISRCLLVWPLRKFHSSLSFRQVYWWYQVLSNTLEVMFALTFFLTLQRRFSSSAEGILSSIAKLRDDISSIFTGQLLDSEWPTLSVLHHALEQVFGSFLLAPLYMPLQVVFVLLDFHSDILILTMLLPHVFLLWHSITSLVYAVQKTFGLVLKLGKISKATVSRTKTVGEAKKTS